MGSEMSEENKLNEKELKKLHIDIKDQMFYLRRNNNARHAKGRDLARRVKSRVAREKEKLREEELEKLYDDIMHEIDEIYDNKIQDTPEGVARQRTIISKINAHPEVLRVRTNKWNKRTIGIAAAWYSLFYIIMRALEDAEACMLMSGGEFDIYDVIGLSGDLQERIVDSWQYKRLIERLEARLAGEEEPQYDDDDLFEDEYEDMDQYGTIIE